MRKLFFIGLVFASFTSFALQNLYMKHVVAKGETIYSLTKTFEVSVDEIKKVNPGIDINTIKIGETINIPLKTKEVNNASTPSYTKATTSNTSAKHIVKSGESMYAIAKKYGITINDLNKWNSIDNNSIKIGQVLIVSDPMSNKTTTTTTTTYSTTTTATIPNTTTKTVVKANIDEDVTDPTSRTTTTTIANVPSKEPVKTTNSNYVADYYNTKTTASGKTQKGIGMSMADSGDNSSYIALYSGAAIGSMITIKNLMNGKSITAKVIGKIPNLDRNKDVLVKISSNAYAELGALDEKFLVEVIY